MPTPWLAWTRRSLPCKSEKIEVHDPKRITPLEGNPSPITYPRSHKSPCSRSLSTLKDVVHGNTKVAHKSSSSLKDDRSVCSKDSPHAAPVARGRQRKTAINGPISRAAIARDQIANSVPRRKFSGCTGCDVIHDSASCKMVYVDHLSRPGSLAHYQVQPSCPRCGQMFSRFDALEQHHVAFHAGNLSLSLSLSLFTAYILSLTHITCYSAVTELSQEDSSRNIVEIIFRTSWLKKDLSFDSIEKILKIHSSQRTISKFEEYRAMVKDKAANSTHMRKHTRCIADGYELLRFHATTLQCSLGSNSNGGSSSLCTNPSCRVCNIIRSGFLSKKDVKRGIYTTATSGRAHASLLSSGQNLSSAKLAMLVCRVIAGRMYKGYDGAANIEFGPLEGYDSISGALSPYANVDDLYVFSPRAVLPCFVVIYKC
ncbi:hypothetical protein O6H91_08G024400 [Diphasiastrum complanatum]|uniref:Uncharacterized protein n=1 Tax=Diphasiastrum complanatum TaxID=34168 RepID=A0ACC2CW34_DIPCM|nr:hypothetical protein O6H91_08G024400 [Diphasiastrum complanatum]